MLLESRDVDQELGREEWFCYRQEPEALERHPLDEQEPEERADQLDELAVVVLRELPLVHQDPLDGLEVERCEAGQSVRQPQHEEVEQPLVVVPRELVPLAVVVPRERGAPMVGHWDAT